MPSRRVRNKRIRNSNKIICTFYHKKNLEFLLGILYKMFKNFLQNERSMIIISIILGLGLAAIFREGCNGRECVVYKAPPPKEIHGHVFKHDKKCYKFSSHSMSCPVGNQKVIEQDCADQEGVRLCARKAGKK